MTDKAGNRIEDRGYTRTDMNRSLVLEKRDEAVATRTTTANFPKRDARVMATQV